MFRMITLTLALTAASPAARACETALVLAMDVSGSVDAGEYALQVLGVAGALRDPDVVGALVQGRVALTVMQWSGAMEQTVTLPWTRVDEPNDALRLASRVGLMPRAHAGGNTAVGEAVAVAAELFAQVPDCGRWVIDVSGDGDENEGFSIAAERRNARTQGITINGLAIEGAATGTAITNFYRSRVVTPGGFVITAQQHDDFARAMREKILRELVAPIAFGPGTLEPQTAFLHLHTR